MHTRSLRLGYSVLLAFAMSFMLATAPANADTFNLSPITIDTHSISGTTGYLLFSYGPDTTGSTPVDSTVSVSSASFSTFSLNNSGASNYQLEPFTFGSTFTFTPTFNTTATTGADEGNILSVFAMDNAYNPYQTTDPTGSNAAVTVVQFKDGSVSTPTTYAVSNHIAPVPETSTLTAFALLAIAGLFVIRRRQSAQ